MSCTAYGFWPFTSTPSASDDQANGTTLVTAYATEAMNYPANFPYATPQAFISYAEGVIPGFCANVGALVRMNIASESMSDAQTALVALADSTEGQATLTQIVQAAGGSGGTINWSVAIPTVASQTAAQAASTALSAAQGIGSGVLSITKNLPLILLAGGAIYLFTKAGGIEKIAALKTRS